MAHDSHTKATLARRRLIGQLERAGTAEATALAGVLDACTPAAPCQSAACPVCGLAFQAAATSAVERFIRTPARAIRNRMTAITVVPASGCLAPSELSVQVFEQVGAQITTALATLDLPSAIIGLEASFNEDTTGRFEDHCCVHGHLIQYDWLSATQEAALRAVFPPSRLVRQPVHCVPLDRRNEGVLYPFKPERVRRVTILKEDHPTRAPYRDPKRRDLRTEQAISLALVEHRLGFGQRLLNHGIDAEAFKRHFEGLGWARDGP